MAGTIILPCNCKDDFQDKMYGKGMRVHNKSTKYKGDCYCTVCSPSVFRTLRYQVRKAGDKKAKQFKDTSVSKPNKEAGATPFKTAA